MNFNKVILIGRITKDPELRNLPNGTAVTKFGLATNHVFKNKAGEKVETAQFHNCVAFGRTAETISQYVKKGQEICVEGRIDYKSWDKKDGTGKAYATEIIVENMQMGQKAREKDGLEPKTQERPEAIGREDIPIIEEKDEGELRVEDIQF
jgi:single-strand DNA-binding protein